MKLRRQLSPPLFPSLYPLSSLTIRIRVSSGQSCHTQPASASRWPPSPHQAATRREGAAQVLAQAQALTPSPSRCGEQCQQCSSPELVDWGAGSGAHAPVHQRVELDLQRSSAKRTVDLMTTKASDIGEGDREQADAPGPRRRGGGAGQRW